MELKNDLSITGTLHSVDQYMNIKLDNVKVVNEDKFPHMVRSTRHCMSPADVIAPGDRVPYLRVIKCFLCSFQYEIASFGGQL